MSPRRSLPRTYHELLDLLPDEAGMGVRRAPTRRVIEARNAVTAAEEELREAVWSAYESGDSWLTIGTILGITRQAAHQRFGRRPAAADLSDEGT
jgi:hypothetical protein